MSHQIKNISNEIETIKIDRNLGAEKYNSWNNSTEGLDRRFEQAEERLGEPKDRSIEIIQSKKSE